MTSDALTSNGKSIRSGFLEISVAGAIAISLLASGFATAGDNAAAKCTDVQKTTAAQTTRAAARPKAANRKVATQKLMRNPWEKIPAEVVASRPDVGKEEIPYLY